MRVSLVVLAELDQVVESAAGLAALRLCGPAFNRDLDRLLHWGAVR